jgi:hypothetical protein
MALAVLQQLKQALTNLNPEEVRAQARKPIRIGLVAASQESLACMEAYFAPPTLSPERRAQALRTLIRVGPGYTGGSCDIDIYESSLLRPANAFSLDLDAPEDCIRRILKRREDLMLALAAQLEPFRNPAAHKIIRAVAKENAFFSLATALPDIVPGILSLPWALGEFSSDTAFLTVNQIRMTFLLAAASDRPVGYREQRSEIASIIAGCFGWRAIARELIGKIPFGGGLIPKAGVAWAGTFAVGLSFERLYRLGYGFTRAERKAVYEDAIDHGRQIAGMLLENLRHRKPAVVAK